MYISFRYPSLILTMIFFIHRFKIVLHLSLLISHRSTNSLPATWSNYSTALYDSQAIQRLKSEYIFIIRGRNGIT